MPTENDKTPPAPPAADPRDSEILKLKRRVIELETDVQDLNEDIEDLTTALEKTKGSKQDAPAGDYCVLGGKTYEVAGTVHCRFATDEGRKGNIDLESELVVLKR